MPSTTSSSSTKSPAKIPSTVVINTSNQHPPTQHVPSTSRPLTHPSTANPQPQTPAAVTPATPCGRWETLYVYAFLVKFLPPAVDDLHDAVGFEEAIVSTGFNQILYDILHKFLTELRPHPEEPTTPDNINAVLQSVVVQSCAKSPLERTVWWLESSKTNAHPFSAEGVDFFAMSWQDKLVVLRQLVDWQLAYSNAKEIIDIAWEVKYQRKKKKTNKTLAAEFAPPDEDDPMSINNLRMVAIGQDSSRIRYWVVDDSPRVWASPNPWRMNCPMTVVATTRDEYAVLVKKIRDTAPVVAEGTKTKLTKPQQAHVELLPALEARLDAIDAHMKLINILKHQRQAERDESEQAVEDDERTANESGSKTRSRATTRKSDEAEEMDMSEDNIEAGPSTSKRKTKGRSSASKKAAGKKRKREPSPAPSDPDEDEDAPQEVEEPALEEAPVKPAAKGKAAAASGRRKSGRGSEAKKHDEVDDSAQEEERAATPKAKSTTKSKTKGSLKVAPTSPAAEEPAAPEGDENMTEEQPHQALGRRRSTRNSTARVSTTQPTEEDGNAAATSSVSSRPKKSVSSRTAGSRRSGRFAKPEIDEMDQDVKPDPDANRGASVSGLVPALDDASLEANEKVKAPPRKKTRTGRRSQAQAEDKMECGSASTAADEDKMDVDASSTDATASPTDTGARKKLPPSESGDTTPVNPARALSALGPQSPKMKSDWASETRTTSETSPAKVVSAVAAT